VTIKKVQFLRTRYRQYAIGEQKTKQLRNPPGRRGLLPEPFGHRRRKAYLLWTGEGPTRKTDTARASHSGRTSMNVPPALPIASRAMIARTFYFDRTQGSASYSALLRTARSAATAKTGRSVCLMRRTLAEAATPGQTSTRRSTLLESSQQFTLEKCPELPTLSRCPRKTLVTLTLP